MLEHTKPLLELGFSVHWLHPQSKRPIGSDWQKKPTQTFGDLKRSFKEDYNVGIRLGEWSRTDEGCFHAIDLDCRKKGASEEAWQALDNLFPSVNFSNFWRDESGSGNGSGHIIFVTDNSLPSKKLANSGVQFTDDEGKKHYTWEIELFGTGKQIAIPPSIHPDTGRKYRWVKQPSPDDVILPYIPYDDLANLVFPDGEKADHDGCEVAHLGLTYEEAEAYLKLLPTDDWCEPREEWRNVGMALHHEFGGHKDALEVWCEWSSKSKKFTKSVCKSQWHSFGKSRGDPITMATVVQAAKKAERQAEIEAAIAVMDDDDDDIADERLTDASLNPVKRNVSDGPDLSILSFATIPAPKFKPEWLGKNISKWVEKRAREKGAPDDFVIAALLATAASVIGNSYRVSVHREFEQPISLWTMVIGNPSTNKTPGIKSVINLLRPISAEFMDIAVQNHQHWEHEKIKAEEYEKHYVAELRQAIKQGKEPPERPQEARSPKPPIRRDFIFNDLTIEAFVEAQVSNPRGFLVYRDEIAGWLNAMERNGNTYERAGWIEAYDGGDFKKQRVTTGITDAKNINASLIGGIQPERLNDFVNFHATDDGLMARIIPFYPDSHGREMHFAAEKDRLMGDTLLRLAEITMPLDESGNLRSREIRFTEAARDAFKVWADDRKQREKNAHSRLLSAFGKAEGMVVRLAAVLELLWWAADLFSDDGPPTRVTTKALKTAIRMREEYIKPMQRRVFSDAVETEERSMARSIARWIVNENVGTFNARKMKREGLVPGISGRTPQESLDDALLMLAQRRWFVSGKKGKNGRPSSDYTVNPEVMRE